MNMDRQKVIIVENVGWGRYNDIKLKKKMGLNGE